MKRLRPLDLIWHAMRLFRFQFGVQATEVWIPDEIRAALMTDERVVHYAEGPHMRIFGMRLYRHDGPLTLIARKRDLTIRWRLGEGLDLSSVYGDEQVAVWKAVMGR